MTSTSVSVDHLVPTRPYGTVGVYRQRLVDRLFGVDAVGAARRAGAEAGRAVPLRLRRTRPLHRPHEGQRVARRAGEGRRGRARTGGGARRSASASRGSASPRPSWIAQKQTILRARERALAEKDNVAGGVAGQRVHAQLPQRRDAAVAGRRVRAGAALRARDHARRDQPDGEGVVSRDQPPGHRQRAREGGRDRPGRGRAGRGPQERAPARS